MAISIKIPTKWFKYLNDYKQKEVITNEELYEHIWIAKNTFYYAIKNWKASHKTIKKLKEFLKSNWYDID